MYLQSIKSVKQNAANSVDSSTERKADIKGLVSYSSFVHVKEETPRVGQNLDLKEGEPRGQSVDVKEETTRSEPISEGGDLEELFGDNLDNENGTSWKQRDQNMKIKKTYTWQHPLHE
jgi:hypothetical protein